MSTITAGYDLFQTVEGEANFTFSTSHPVPANFFHKGSAPFMGTIRFEGRPIRKFKDPRSGKEHSVGMTDTIVERKKDVIIKAIGGSGTTEIELVRLSLRSCCPIKVQVGRSVQRWDVHLGVSHSARSVGNITITQTSEHGGTFESEIQVVPHFRFERLSDGAERQLDMGALSISDEKQ